MPKIIPSLVVEIIDSLFPQAKAQIENKKKEYSISRSEHIGVSALLTLVEQIPPELLTLDSKENAEFQMSIASIRSTMAQWPTRDFAFHKIPGYSQLNPISIIRKMLAKCPDQGILPSTQDLSFIDDADLKNVLRIDISATNSSYNNGEWKAATVLAGSIVEALLLYFLHEINKIDPKKITESKQNMLQSLTLVKDPGSDLDKWTLHQLLELSAHISFISADTASQCRLAKDYRNLIHPGRTNRLMQLCNRGTALSALAALEHVINDLEKNKSLIKP